MTVFHLLCTPRARTPPTAPPVKRSTETIRRRFRGLRDHQEEVQRTSETIRRRFRGLRARGLLALVLMM